MVDNHSYVDDGQILHTFCSARFRFCRANRLISEPPMLPISLTLKAAHPGYLCIDPVFIQAEITMAKLISLFLLLLLNLGIIGAERRPRGGWRWRREAEWCRGILMWLCLPLTACQIKAITIAVCVRACTRTRTSPGLCMCRRQLVCLPACD